MAENKRLKAIFRRAESEDSTLYEAPMESSDAAAEEQHAPDEWQPQEVEEEAPSVASRSGWLLPSLAIFAALGWTAFFVWVNHQEMGASGTPARWSDWIVDWSVPILLIVGIWLLAMRNSRREASRFTAAAQALSEESQRLERRLSAVNRELSLARDFIAAQSRDLESLGRLATERLSQNADRLQALIHDNGEQVEAIGRVSSTALANMDRLRDDLPVISNSARDVANQIGHAGEVARRQIDEMAEGLTRLNEFGEASGRQVIAVRGKVEDAVTAFEMQAGKLDEILGARFTALAEHSSTFRAELDSREVEAFAALRRRADALGQEMAATAEELSRLERESLTAAAERMAQVRDEASRLSAHLREGEVEARERWSAEIVGLEERLVEAIRKIAEVDTQGTDSARRRLRALSDEAARVDQAIADRVAEFEAQRTQREAAIAEREEAALAELEQRFAGFDERLSERQEEQLAHASGLAERGEALAARLRELSAQMEDLVAQGQHTHGGLSEAATALAASVEQSRMTLAETGTTIASLTDDSVRLLELIRSSAEHSGEKLPRALGQAEARLSAFEFQARALSDLIGQAADRGSSLTADMASARAAGSATLQELAAVETKMSALVTSSESLASRARGELTAAIATLEQAAQGALMNLELSQADAIREMAERIGSDSSTAIADTLRDHATAAITELEEAAQHASKAGRETARQLRDQLARINELAGNLEQRVAYARQQAEEQVDNDFARRMALIMESLNSSAIDISKAFANDVTDTAWASYLRGDRGIFTRRAVRLLDNQEVRGVVEVYQRDGDFRETVNRYIHDFEAMLRSVLSTRDGHTLAVTLLSSDMGKLYVALAQAIDRLRT